jgi:hypothetical protein
MARRAFKVPVILEWMNALLAALAPGTLNGVTEILVAGTPYKVADLRAKLASIQAVFQAVVDGETALAMAVEALNEQGPAGVLFVRQTRAAVKGGIGKQSVALEAYGMKPDKTPEPLTVEATATKVARAAATREARHTVGPKAKSRIKGKVAPPAPAAGPGPRG